MTHNPSQARWPRLFYSIIGGAAGATIIVNLLVLGLLGFYNAPSSVWLPTLLGFGGYSFASNIAVAGSVGLTWHAVAHGFGWHSASACWVTGLVMGAALASGIFAVFGVSYDGYSIDGGWALIATAAYGAALGALTGLFAWLIRRPDRDAHG